MAAKKPLPLLPLPNFKSKQDLEAHARLCQCLIAFGIGAGPIRVTAGAAHWFYARLWPSFQSICSDKKKRCWWLDLKDDPTGKADPALYRNEATQILDLCRSVGRHAASVATCRGCFAIEEEDVNAAMSLFETYPDQTRGHYCDGGRRKSG